MTYRPRKAWTLNPFRAFRLWRAERRWRRHWESLTPEQREQIADHKRRIETTFFYGPSR